MRTIKGIPPGDIQRMSAGTGVQTGYEQKTITVEEKQGQLKLVASFNGDGDSVKINVTLDKDPKRKGYVHLVKGSLEVNGQKLGSGDALMLSEESLIHISNGSDAEVLVFDLSSN